MERHQSPLCSVPSQATPTTFSGIIANQFHSKGEHTYAWPFRGTDAKQFTIYVIHIIYFYSVFNYSLVDMMTCTFGNISRRHFSRLPSTLLEMDDLSSNHGPQIPKVTTTMLQEMTKYISTHIKRDLFSPFASCIQIWAGFIILHH